ncbi:MULTISPECIES: aminotransferase class IV [unclassified Mucilaginibacter]|uniref:aminotransferase class IV n=1 Tax=unclassified Mucilaginibacter TaxID=2617802 RepID=UPI002AC9D2D2|nr:MULTISPECIES: aminotransferase class IV [unclassified Mucilaginibacter]MEB0261460.1 aminotransferase class IV [Mucilaginibacter sp. 10I4]MEB0276954.1 aminotransferase class IV [Mucilaginibacter sp. 10B2]MEB0301523.1 aminotransferase class IV [Mucilaginibacter sp. 5C4]WPX25054.1 aminotransferase class IV [Mucilaginibacter sp. 5C4]
MPVYINFNGEIIPADSQLLTIANRAFRYGDGLFESMRVMKGKLKFPELHAERLQKGMKALKIDGYSQADSWFLKEKVEELARRNKIKHGRLRLTVFRDAEGLYAPTQNKMAYCLEIQPIEEPRYFLNERGLIMDVYTELPKPLNWLSNIKTCNSLIYVMAGIYKQQNKLDDVFLINQNRYLCEANSSNIFVWYQNHLYTPALSEGCVEGVMRKVVIQLALDNNIPVTEAQINPEILNEADEVFLTNATKGIQWVMGYGVKRYFNRISKTLMDELNKL